MAKLILILILFSLNACSERNLSDFKTNTSEPAAYKKEWHGESGYANCLLVAMSRLQISSVNLYASKPLPNLTVLTEPRPDTNKWIRAQELQYSQLDQLTVIRLLAESAGITSETKSLTGIINVHDVVGDNGDIVQRNFDIELKFIGDEPALAVIQRSVKG